MTALDDEMLPLAMELLEEFGARAVHLRIESMGYNPNSLDASPAPHDWNEYFRTLLASQAIPESSYVRVFRMDPEIADIEGGLVEQGDEVVLLAGAALASAPERGDAIAFPGSDILTVKKLRPIWSGEKVALWRLAVHR